MRQDLLMHPCKQKALLVNRQENVEALPSDSIEDEGQISVRIARQARTTVEAGYESREAAQAERVWIANLYVMPVEPECSNCLPRRRAGTFRKKNTHDTP
jgi:hypothetical protein